MMEIKALVLIHPRARRRDSAKLEFALAALRGRGFEIKTCESKDAEDVTRLTREGLQAGATLIIPVGGDGMLNLSVQGFFEGTANLFPNAALMPLPFGTGNDFYRGFIPTDRQRDLTWLAGPLCEYSVSLGFFTCKDDRTRAFINSFSCGVTTAIMEDYERSRFRSYFISTITSLLAPKSLEIHVLRRGLMEGPRTSLFFMICKGAFVGGGMRFHKDADHVSGRAKVIWVPEMPFGKVLRNFKNVYRSGIEGIPGVQTFDFEDLKLEFTKSNILAEADGELHVLGQSTTITHIPNCIRVLGPPKD